jgi:hypothetical protein
VEQHGVDRHNNSANIIGTVSGQRVQMADNATASITIDNLNTGTIRIIDLLWRGELCIVGAPAAPVPFIRLVKLKLPAGIVS